MEQRERVQEPSRPLPELSAVREILSLPDSEGLSGWPGEEEDEEGERVEM